jgi:hypothetical protein
MRKRIPFVRRPPAVSEHVLSPLDRAVLSDWVRERDRDREQPATGRWRPAELERYLETLSAEELERFVEML